MAKINIEKLDTQELKELRRRVDERLQNLDQERRRTALEEIKAIARKHGVSVSDLVMAPKTVKPGASGPAKYRHPENAEMTWTGRGRQPSWFKDYVAANGSPDHLRVA